MCNTIKEIFSEDKNMDITKILSTVDHTLLSQSATWDEIKAICDDGIKYGCASVCIPPSYVKKASEYADGKIKICTVIGFPNGYNTTKVKCFEATDAVENGADEIDMVINIGMLKDKKYEELFTEISEVKKACRKPARNS
jgi:deoxyribose-phosphate aldolase